jgi:RNA polymerase sigma-B factor
MKTRKTRRAESAHLLLRNYHERGDLRARQLVIEQYLPLVHALARRYAHRGEPIEDLVQVGSLGLVKAVDRFQPSRRIGFATFATPTILGEIRRHLRDAATPVRLPRRLQEMEHLLARLAPELEATLNRPPTLGELARRAGIGEEEARQAVALRLARAPVSLSDQPSREIDAGLSELGARWAEDGTRLGEDRALLCAGFRALEPRERRVLHLRYYEGLSQSRIATEVHVSQMQVSRLIRRALEKLRCELTAPAA